MLKENRMIIKNQVGLVEHFGYKEDIFENLKRNFKTEMIKKNGTLHFIVTGNSLEILKFVPSNSIDLIISDPPYNIGLDYGIVKDKMKKEEYLDWCKKHLIECARVLNLTGSIYLISYPETNAYLVPFLETNLKLKFRRWLTWHYPTNIGHSYKNFTRSQRSILFCTKSNKYIFNKEHIIQHYKNPKVSKIKERLKKGFKGRGSYDLLRFADLIELNKKIDVEDVIRFLDSIEKNEGLIDVLDFNLVKNVSKQRVKGHPCQLPLGLLKVLIKVSSDKNMWVLDPFAGTFAVSAAAAELSRNSIGIEINPNYVKLGLKRLKYGK